jgi:hypothetical protein
MSRESRNEVTPSIEKTVREEEAREWLEEVVVVSKARGSGMGSEMGSGMENEMGSGMENEIGSEIENEMENEIESEIEGRIKS